MDLDNALAQLAANGLRPKLFSLSGVQEIRGVVGERLTNGVAEITDIYVIYFRNNSWIAAIPGISTDIVISSSIDLAEVIDAVCTFYRLRETTALDETTIQDAEKLLSESGLILTRHYTDVIWATTQREQQTAGHHILETFGIFSHADTWVAAYFSLVELPHVIKYSRSLGEVVQAVLDFYHERDEVHPEK